MSDLTLILLAAGASTRFKINVKKQWLRIQDKPLWEFVAQNFNKRYAFDKIIIAAPYEDVTFMDTFTDFLVVAGADTRQQSLKNALTQVTTPYVLVSDIARPCIGDKLFNDLLKAKGHADCIVPAIKVHDTVVYDNQTIDREKILRIQTPQLSKTNALIQALQSDTQYTDESSAIVANKGSRIFVDGDDKALKVTTVEDLKKLQCLKAPQNVTLIGNGFDVHQFDTSGTMYLGGVKIDHNVGFLAHSDGDVALHALIDALLGAAGLGDIGMLFPDNDSKYKGIDSKILLAQSVAKLHRYGFVINNIDLTIIAQTPKLQHYKADMRKTIASILQISSSKINVKATTTEYLGFIGRKEGVGVLASASLSYLNWKDT